jgi:hypothetical protein
VASAAIGDVTEIPEEISGLLAPDEKIVWQARPRPGVFMLRGLPNIAYGVTWSVLGAFWYHGSGGIGKYSAFEGWWKLTPLFSLPFILAGFSFFLYPIRLGARARRTWYVVTNRRVFTAELKPKEAPTLRVFSGENIAALQVVKRFDGTWDVVISKRAQDNPHLKPRLEDGFFGVVDGEEVARAIRDLKPSSS